MNFSFAAVASLFLLTHGVFAAEKPAVVPHPVTLTFYIAGVECSACSSFINEAAYKVPSVKEIMPEEINVVNISFDTHVASAHQVAQAISEALPIHGKPYEATLKIRVPDYAKGDNAARVDAVFAKRSEWVKAELLDKAKGEFAVHFLPLKVDPKKAGPQGWNPGHFGHAIHDPAPKGLGLAFAIVQQGQAAPDKK